MQHILLNIPLAITQLLPIINKSNEVVLFIYRSCLKPYKTTNSIGKILFSLKFRLDKAE